MSLSCSCDWDGDEPDWYWWPPEDFTKFPNAIARCCAAEGCKTLINLNDDCGKIRRTRPGTEWEDDHGIAALDDPEAVDLASHYVCEKCAGLFFSFQDLGFNCVSPYENMLDLLKDYKTDYQPGGMKKK